ncbi:MAG: ECF-type sigma factor [Acidobacteriota bacterium]
MKPALHELTELLRAHVRNEPGALDQVMAAVYDDLRRIARRQLQYRARRRGMGTTSLVHEAYLKLAAGAPVDYQDRGHFFAVAARVMRQIVMDFAKRQLRSKRGGGQTPVDVDKVQLAVQAEAERMLMLDDALTRLAAQDERLVRVVECRYFAGLSEEETADALGVSVRTAERAWREARELLRAALAP